MSWDNLSLRQKAEIIKTGVKNGLTDIDSIKEAYNKFDNGGYKEETPYSAGHLMDAIYDNSTVENLGEPSHHYDFTQSEEWANAHGYYPDARGHRDDRVKKEAHPTHSSRGIWKSPYQFELSDRGLSDSNYTLFGLADGGQDPQATMTYNGSIVLPELTVTPQGNYIHNSYDNLNIHKRAYGGNLYNEYDIGGFLDGLIGGAKDLYHGAKKIGRQAYNAASEAVDDAATATGHWITKQVTGVDLDKEAQVRALKAKFRPKVQAIELGDTNVTGNFIDYKRKHAAEFTKAYEKEYNDMDSNQVTQLQQSLAEDGYYTGKLLSMSKKEVEGVQRNLKKKGLYDGVIDGIVGEKTKEGWNTYNVDGLKGKFTKEGFMRQKDPFTQEVSTKGVDGCAQWVTKKFETLSSGRSLQNGVVSNAWQMPMNMVNQGGQMIYNLYADGSFDDIKDAKTLKAHTESALKKNRLDYSQVKVGDIVGIYIPSSDMIETALKDGTTKNTHVGIVTGIDKNGVPIIEHNIHGSHRKDRIDRLTGTKTGKAQVTTVTRPKEPYNISGIDTSSKKSKIKIDERFENPTMTAYLDGIEGSRELVSALFPDVNFDNVALINAAVQKRETGFSKQKGTDLTGWDAAKQKLREFVHAVKETKEEDISSNLTKTKLSTLTPQERAMLNIRSAKDLENPTKAGLFNSYNLAKNMSYFQRYRDAHPELGLTDDDITNLTILSYNQGMNKLKNIGYDDYGELDPSEIDKIRRMSKHGAKIRDYTSTNWRYADKIMPGLGKMIYDAVDKGEGFTPYISAARDAMGYITQENRDRAVRTQAPIYRSEWANNAVNLIRAQRQLGMMPLTYGHRKKSLGGNLFEIGGPTGDTPPSDGTLIYNGLVNGVKDIVHGIDNFAEQAEDPLLYTTMGLEGATVIAPNPYTAGAAYVTSLAGAGIDGWQGARALYKAGSAAINGDWETAKEEAKTAGRKTKVVTKTGTVTAKSKAREQALRSAAVSVPIEASQAYYHNREGISDFFTQQEKLRQERLAMSQPVKRKKK